MGTGPSVGKVTEGIIGPRARTLFHLVIFFGVSLAMGVFVFVIARLFSIELAPGQPGYPQTVFPTAWTTMLLAYAFLAPVLVFHPEGSPPIFPYVFIIIACGAASGFHGLVSSGTTAKQLDKETDARPIGFGE